jgi:hypothetical protein
MRLGNFRKCALLNRAAHLREDIARIGADQTDCAYHNHEHDRQHHRVFGDILTVFVGPEPVPPSVVSCPIHDSPVMAANNVKMTANQLVTGPTRLQILRETQQS